MDLGSVQPIKRIALTVSHRGLWNFQIWLSDTTNATAGHPCQTTMLNYYYPGDHNVRRGWRRTMSVQCIGAGRYVTVRKRTYDWQALAVCELQVFR